MHYPIAMPDAADLAIAQRLDPLLKLDPKQRAFAINYSKSANGTDAARKAGYSKTGAHTTANRLLARQDIQQALQELWTTQAIAAGITPERVATEVAIIAFDRSGNIREQDRLKAMELLSRYLGMFNDRVTVNIDDPDIIEAARTAGVDVDAVVAELGTMGITSPQS